MPFPKLQEILKSIFYTVFEIIFIRNKITYHWKLLKMKGKLWKRQEYPCLYIVETLFSWSTQVLFYSISMQKERRLHKRLKGKKKPQRKKKPQSYQLVVAYVAIYIGFSSSRIQTEFQVSAEVAKYFLAVIVPGMYTSWRQVIRSWNIYIEIDILAKLKSEHNLKTVGPSLLICFTLLQSFTMD